MLQGKLTYASLIAMLIVSLADVFGVKIGEEETTKVVEAVVLVALFISGVYGRWRATK